ncbi:MAG: CHRD domain-containing protein [Vicinamibacteria bacterium]
MKRTLIGILALVGVVALALVSTAGGTATQKGKGKPSKSATPVFKLNLKTGQEVDPEVEGLKAKAGGHVTFDLTRNPAGAITSGEVVFYFNYSFPGPVQISGLHIHKGNKGQNGGIEIGAVLSAADSALDQDGRGNVTSVVSGDPAKLQAILDNPRGYYVNLHTTTPNFPAGAMRAQMHNPKKR